MRETIILLALTLLSVQVIAQNDRSKKVDTKYLQLPVYDISATDPSTVSAEFAAAEVVFGEKKLKDTKSTCIPKGGGLKDAVELSTYYYEVGVIKPESFLIGKNASGEVIYAEQISKEESGSVNFGYDECANWVADKMKQDWEDSEHEFKNSQSKTIKSDLLEQANKMARTQLFPSFIGEEIEVYGAKGKDFDYSQLDKALDDALLAYKELDNHGPSENAFGLLEGSVAIWEKEVKELDEDNKKARINVSIAKGLYENLANAYTYLYQNEKAIKAGMKCLDLFGNFSNNRSQGMEARIRVIKMRMIASENNAGIVSDVRILTELAGSAGSAEITVHTLPGDQMARLESDYRAFVATHASAQRQAEQEQYEKAVASGEVNPYEKYVTETSTQGKIIMMTAFMAPELTEFPKEICAMDDLKQVVIMGNQIASIPSEISRLVQLNKLDLSNNKLTSLPAEIGQLKELKTLNLAGNPISEIPEEIKNCSSLKTVNLKKTNLSAEAQQKIASLIPNAKIKF